MPEDEASKKLIVTHTEIIGGGESDSVTFAAPEVGEYPYLRGLPGRFAMMPGQLSAKVK
ncbi:MAG: hypothetical protein KDN05_00510 [Verrucomicrobiae bacterium]|nr:hypothetical protein [Verrucomicrobiae bacterium]